MTSQTTPRPQAIVTGGSRGIGRASCVALARAGFDVAFTFKSGEDKAAVLQLELEALGSRAKAYLMDLSDPSSISSSIEKILTDYPHPQTLVNNAGISMDALSLRLKLEDFDKLLSTNLTGPFLVTQAVLRPMMKARSGSVIFMSSVIGLSGNAGQMAYAASKSALFGMTKSLAKEFGSRQIRFNAIAPGFIQTDMTSTLPEATKQSINSEIPLGFLGDPEDVANAVVFLSTPVSRYITGQVLSVNGGLYM